MPPSIALSRLPKEHAQAIKKRGSHRRLCCFPNSCCTNGTKRRSWPATQNPPNRRTPRLQKPRTVNDINTIDAGDPPLRSASSPARRDSRIAPCTCAQLPRLAISRSKHDGARAAALSPLESLQFQSSRAGLNRNRRRRAVRGGVRSWGAHLSAMGETRGDIDG
jgi:hypothetical protein